MQCKIKRSIFELFKIYKCSECAYNKNDEIIQLGTNIIGIYYLFNDCLKEVINVDQLLINNRKAKTLLKEAILFQDKIIFLFIDDFNLNKYMNIIDILIDFGLDVQIMVI